MSEEKIAVIARVTGRVQGVSFRAWTQAEAQRRGLTGWVRNETDGSVTTLLCGPKYHVELMIELLHDGPKGAWVSGITTDTVQLPEECARFEIKR
ncbi:acylphosphatase [Oricola cellulosilytica]|uniref:Acylphosphatase n=1 Tax=Oricola cellulosilytica TaxID=1429082 RepID=A0A4R0P857_9HYPH|nr:acylphosphatase [Oricola cellulosilytica]TCD11800.1 acylphosphatase [Oricola cellulosilytica]